MKSESLQETLSALMDNEATELEVHRVLQATEQDPALRSTWDRFQVARSVMHKEPWQGKIDLSAGIAAALANEPTPGAEAVAPAARASGLWQTMGKLAVAASVTVAVLVGVRMVNQDGAPAEPAMAERPAVEQSAPVAAAPVATPQPQQGGAVLAGYPANSDAAAAPSEWQEERIGDYMRRHAEQGVQGAAPQLVPHARAASLDDK